ncbi:hypothetical protein FRX31_012219, partial [Thalictrum thalictroides]
MMDIAAVLKELPKFVGPSKGAPAYGQNYLYGWYKPQNPHIVGLADEFSRDEEPQHNGVYRKEVLYVNQGPTILPPDPPDKDELDKLGALEETLDIGDTNECEERGAKLNLDPTNKDRPVIHAVLALPEGNVPVILSTCKELDMVARKAEGVIKRIPLEEIYASYPKMKGVINEWEEELNHPESKVHVMDQQINEKEKETSCFVDTTTWSLVTKVEVVCHKNKFLAIVDSGAPMTIVSTKLMARLKIAPDIDYTQEYATAGYSVPFVFDNDPPKGTKKISHMGISYANSIFALPYEKFGKLLPTPPTTTEAKDGIPIYATCNTTIAPGTQQIFHTGIKYHVPAHMYMIAKSVPNASYKDPRVCPGWYSYGAGSLSVIAANVTRVPIHIKKRQIIGYLKLHAAKDVVQISKFGDLSELGIVENVEALVAFVEHNEVPKLTEEEFTAFRKILDDMKTLFSTGPANVGQAVGVQHKIDVGDAIPFRQRPYWKSQTEEDIIADKIQALID